MAENPNVQAVQRAYEAFKRGDIPAILQMVTDDVKWTMPGTSELPLAGKRTGRNEVAEFFRLLGETEQVLEFTPRTFLSEGDTVAVLGHYRAQVSLTGRKTDFDWVQVFTMRDGRVAAWEEFLDTASVLSAYKTEEAAAKAEVP